MPETKTEKRKSSYRDLIAWQKGMDLALLTYRTTTGLPEDEHLGLQLQMRSCALSIPCSVARGWGLYDPPEFIRCLQDAKGATRELAVEAEVCAKLGFDGDWRGVAAASDECARILGGLISSIEERKRKRNHGTDN